MSCLKHIERLRIINRMIRRKNTGSAVKMGSSLGISVRTVYYYLNDLKSLGAPICWSPFHNSYIYKSGGEFRIEFAAENCNSGCPWNEPFRQVRGQQNSEPFWDST